MNAFLLVGSPKGHKSASYLLGSMLTEGMRKRGAAVNEGMVHEGLRTEDGTARLLDSVDAADLVIFAFPLYIDSLPAPFTRLLERIAERRARVAPGGSPRLADGGAIPEAATTLFAKPLMPRWMYTMVGNWGWRMQLRKNKARRPLTYRPYSQG